MKASRAPVMFRAQGNRHAVAVTLPCPYAVTQVMDFSGRSAQAQVATQDAASVRLGAHVGAFRFGCSLTLACCLHCGAAHGRLAFEGAVPGHAGTSTFSAIQALMYSIRLVIRATLMRALDSRMLTNSPSRPGTMSAPRPVAIA